MRSLRNRLVAATLAATLLILLAAGCFLYGLIRSALLAEFDTALLAKARALASLSELDAGRFELDLEAAQMPGFEPGQRPEYFKIWSSDGSTLARSASLAQASLDGVASQSGEASYRFVELPDGRPGRQVMIATRIRTDAGIDGETENDAESPAVSSAQAEVTIAVARDTLDFRQTLWQLLLLLGSVSLGAALLSAVVLMAVVSFTLKPVKDLAAQISQIDAANVASLGPLSCSIEELDPVVHRLNELLKRLDKVLTRERAFTAEVAHELRTPLAAISAALEVCALRPREQAEYREVIRRCLATTHTMHAMVENLLTLARADAGQLVLRRESFDLAEFAAECWRPFEEPAAERSLLVSGPGSAEPVRVATDREKLRLVLQNLVDNAVRHANDGGRVAIHVARDANEAVLEVRNTGCTLSPDALDNVFEPFWKGDAARTEGAEHCGLGLPLCRKIVEILDGSITATVDDGSFTVRLRLPLAMLGCEADAAG